MDKRITKQYDDVTNDRPEAYPKPSDADSQYNNQNEFIDQQPNDMKDRSISDVKAPPGTLQSDKPEVKERGE